MANVLTRLFTRIPAPPPTIIASGELVDINDSAIVDSILKRHESWQDKTFNAYDTCGMITNGVDTLADLISRITVHAAEQPTERDSEPKRTTNTEVVATMDRLGSVVDVAALLRKLTQEMMLPGACNLVGIQPVEGRDNVTEEWVVVSIKELEKATYSDEMGDIHETVAIVDYKDGRNLVLRPDAGDTWIRIWREHPKKRNSAHSPIRPLLSTVEELLWWEAAASAVAKNRLIMSGLVGLPSNIELPIEAGEDGSLSGATRFAKRLIKSAMKTLSNPSSGAAVVPIFYTYPWNEHGRSGVDVTEFERKQDQLLTERIRECKLTIAQGFPLPVESFFGLSEAPHWGSGQIENSKFRENVEPFVIFLVTALTVAWLRPILRALGVDNPEKYMIWYDASALIVHPDMGQAADKGAELGFINGKAWRRTRNFSESDAPTDEEKAEMLEWLRGLRGRDRMAPEPTGDSDDPDAVPDQPRVPGQRAPERQPAAPVRGKGQPVLSSANGDGRVHPPEHLLTQLQVFGDEKVRRALEKAGNRLISRARKNKSYAAVIKGQPQDMVASILGREAVTKLDIDTLFDDCFTDIHARLVAFAHPYYDITTNYSPVASEFTAYLRNLACEHLFSPPTSDLMVDRDVIATTLDKLSPALVSS